MRLQPRTLALLLACFLAPPVASAPPAPGVVVPISQELGTGIAGAAFPLTLKLKEGNLRLSSPRMVFQDPVRIKLAARFQAYDYRPRAGVAASETGDAVVSGVLGYDAVTGEVLIHQPRLEHLAFDRTGGDTAVMRNRVMEFWQQHATPTIRSELPPHPYLALFANRIADMAYDGRVINMVLRYE